jgi:ferric-dicitrate binding protein FerR (iron transport regulator)
MEPVRRFEELGQATARGLDAYAGERLEAIEQARRGYLESALGTHDERKAPRPRRLWLAAAALAGAVVTGILLFFLARQPIERPLTFTAGGEQAAVETWLAAPAERPLALAFSDGSELRVEPASRVRVVDVDGSGASVAVENGALHAEVVHKARSRWRVIAGPITVRVTGTRFHVSWSALTEQFTLAVFEGSVTAAGSIVGAERPVVAGETLRVFVGEGRLELLKAQQAVRSAPVASDSVAAVKTPEAPERPPAEAPRAEPSVAREPEPDWRAHAAKGSLRKAFTTAEASGFSEACGAASAAELLQLGDGARLAGRPDRAEQALLTLRRRFPSDPRRAAAAFALGKVAFDQRRSYAQAATWFRTSIAEQPNGSLAREASGRLIEALRNSGDGAGARQAAEKYLQRYPAGPHADVARSLVE